MRKAHSIALAVVVALVAAAPAQAEPPSAGDTTVGKIVTQEQARTDLYPGAADDAGAAAALEARSEALNQEYGLGAADDAGAAAALEARSEELNQEYGLGDGNPQDSGNTSSTVDQIVKQEQGRGSDPTLLGSSGAAPVLVAGPSDRFDFGDAAVGGAAAFALALFAAAAVVLSGGRRTRSEGVAG